MILNQPARPWNQQDQREFLNLLLKGASPLAAAQHLGLNPLGFQETLAHDDLFNELYIAAQELLSQNIAARLYQEAMKGNVSAMTLYLKNRPPPEWLANQTSLTSESFEYWTHEELLRFAKLQGVSIPPELETPPHPESGDQPS